MDKGGIINAISENYSRLTAECQSELLDKSTILIIKKNTTLVKEGKTSDKTFYIVKGSTRAFYLKEGKDISDWFAFENEFISSINSFFHNIPSPHFIEVLEDSVLLELSRESIEQLSNKYPDFERLSKVIITNTMLQLQERISSIQFQSAEQRYKSLLATRPNITQKVSLTHIASYIGITLETLSRIRNPKKRI